MVAIADGIGSSRVSAVASSLAVRAMVEDYYCTPDSWVVKTAASRVIAAVNSWLHAETRRGASEPDQGYVCTLSALVLKGRVAHLFHVGDARISRLSGRALERLTEDHRVRASSEQSYLARAIGAADHVEIDYSTAALAVGDVFVLTTDGVHDHLAPDAIAAAIGPDLEASASRIVARALAAGSPDNLTVQLVRIDALPDTELDGFRDQAADLPPAPTLSPGETLDGYRVLRALHDSARSHLYLATDSDGGMVVLKVPSIDLGHDQAYLRRFAMEEWIARRIDNPHVLKARPPRAPRSQLYLVLEHLEGQTLAQWMRDHPAPPLEQVRDIVDQVARGLDAFHRREMVHGDLRPENVMRDAAGVSTIVDFGSVRVAGVAELSDREPGPLGTAQYGAPETLLGAPATPASDVYGLAAIAYQALTGRLPYGALPARIRSAADLRRLRYRSCRDIRPDIPAWVDGALRRALQPSPGQRYESPSEFAHDLRHPNAALCSAIPWSERDPVLFWKLLCLALAVALLFALTYPITIS